MSVQVAEVPRLEHLTIFSLGRPGCCAWLRTEAEEYASLEVCLCLLGSGRNEWASKQTQPILKWLFHMFWHGTHFVYSLDCTKHATQLFTVISILCSSWSSDLWFPLPLIVPLHPALIQYYLTKSVIESRILILPLENPEITPSSIILTWKARNMYLKIFWNAYMWNHDFDYSKMDKLTKTLQAALLNMCNYCQLQWILIIKEKSGFVSCIYWLCYYCRCFY